MCALHDKADIVSEIVLDTEYPVEKLSFTWKISRYSEIENCMSTSVFTRCKATEWYLKLESGTFYIKRNFDGEPVITKLLSGIETCHGISLQETAGMFVHNTEWVKIFHFSPYECSEDGSTHPVKFENDELIFHCSMTLLGHTITSIKSDVKLDSRSPLNGQGDYDISISDGKNSIPLHKDIICAKSLVLREMFQLGMLEYPNGVIEIDNIDFDILEEFVSFLYSEELENLCWDKAQKLYYVADKYEIMDLRKMCSQFLRFHLTVGEACSVLKLADLYTDDALKEAVVFFIQMHASSVKLTKGWKDLVKTHPKLALETLK